MPMNFNPTKQERQLWRALDKAMKTDVTMTNEKYMHAARHIMEAGMNRLGYPMERSQGYDGVTETWQIKWRGRITEFVRLRLVSEEELDRRRKAYSARLERAERKHRRERRP